MSNGFTPSMKARIARVCTPNQAEALSMKHERGMGPMAIGLALGISPQAVHQRLSGGETALNRDLEAELRRGKIAREARKLTAIEPGFARMEAALAIVGDAPAPMDGFSAEQILAELRRVATLALEGAA